MADPIESFDDIVAPLGGERFLSEYLGRKPLHLEGDAGKFRGVMTWDLMNHLLEMTTIWSSASLLLYLDTEQIPPQSYATPESGRDGGRVLRPDPDKVQRQLERGATLVLNDIDQLAPGLRAVARAMEETLGGRVQANLYCSSRRRKGFAAHFDTHDVFAVHVEGEKTWHIYEGRAEDPIAHQAFKTLGREHHERAKGAKLMDVHMRPGDLLYLPRGQYHDAVADEGGTVHIAFGVTYPIGIDVVSMVYERMITEPLARANLPRADGVDGELALKERLAAIGRRLTEVAAHPDLVAQVKDFQSGFRYPRQTYALPDAFEPQVHTLYKVRNDKVRLVQQGGRAGLVAQGSRQAVEVPAGVTDMVAWVLQRDAFSREDILEAFPARNPGEVDKVLGDLNAMRVTVPA